jgi:excisionase family DNA binding protein
MPDEILTLPEVAQLLKVAEKTVYTMAQKSQLPAFKVGGQWRFKRVDIDRWIEQRRHTSSTKEEVDVAVPHSRRPNNFLVAGLTPRVVDHCTGERGR